MPSSTSHEGLRGCRLSFPPAKKKGRRNFKAARGPRVHHSRGRAPPGTRAWQLVVERAGEARCVDAARRRREGRAPRHRVAHEPLGMVLSGIAPYWIFKRKGWL